MTRIATTLLLLLASTFAATSAHAQLFRAYLSVNGNDANPCTLASPCRLLPKAVATVANGGEIWMLDSANFNGGTVAIDKSVKILAVPGALGSVVSVGGGAPAIDIVTGGATVTLRNVSIVPLATAGGATTGIRQLVSARLIVEDSEIGAFTADGIFASNGTVIVSNTTVRGSSGHGVKITGFGTGAVAKSRFFANGTGVVVDATDVPIHVSISDSAFLHNATGVQAIGSFGAAMVYIDRTEIEGSATVGLRGENTLGIANFYLGGNQIRRNPGGAFSSASTGAFGVVLWSTGNNVFAGNGGSAVTLTPAPAGVVQ